MVDKNDIRGIISNYPIEFIVENIDYYLNELEKKQMSFI